MTTNEQRAAATLWRTEIRDGAGGVTVRDSDTLAAALAADGLLAPDGMTVVWSATVVWMSQAGQSEQATGYGTTREEALADARGQDRWLTNAVEVAHRCAHRHITPWAAEDTTWTKENHHE